MHLQKAIFLLIFLYVKYAELSISQYHLLMECTVPLQKPSQMILLKY